MLEFDDLVTRKGYAPKMGQSSSPREVWSNKPPVGNSEDLRRILALPRRALELDGTERAETIIDMMTERFARHRTSKCRCAELDPDKHEKEGCISRLLLIQALALREIGICGGLLGPIGTGHGKTLIDLLAPLALATVGIKSSVLLVPASLAVQLIGDYWYLGQHFKMPQIVFHGHSYMNTCQKMDNLVQLERGTPIVHVVPYSRLSRHEATTWLEQELKPGAIIADECHKLRDIYNTSTGSRVARYMHHHPETRFAGWSGSITAKSLRDYAHLADWALRGGSPLPRDPEVVIEWCNALDPTIQNPADPGPLFRLCEPGESVLNGFRRRLVETVGVVATTSPSVDALLEITERTAPPIPDNVEEALKTVRNQCQRPDGEELVDALSMARVAMQVAAGFFYKWIYPHNEFPRDTDLVLDWLDARKEYNCEVREKLKRREEHLDSPLLCQHAAERAWGDRPAHKGLPTWKCQSWPRWRTTRFKVRPETDTVWLSDYLVHDVVAWANENRGIIWYDHHAFGQRVHELSRLPLFGAGKDAKTALLGDARRGIKGEDGSRSVICSVAAHGTGTNGLQHRFSKMLYPNPMSSPTGWEQSLARLHRIGQKAPIVTAEFYRHTSELQRHVDQALSAATYIETSLGATQKLRMGFKVDPQ